MIYPKYNSESDGIEWLKERQLKVDDPDDYDLGFVLKETGELIGGGGLVYHQDTDIWVIGYNLRKDVWGNGYVVEALMGIMAEIRKTRKIRAIEGIFAVENHKSQRVMEKLGMTYVEDTEYEKLDGSAHFLAKKYQRVWEWVGLANFDHTVQIDSDFHCFYWKNECLIALDINWECLILLDLWGFAVYGKDFLMFSM